MSIPLKNRNPFQDALENYYACYKSYIHMFKNDTDFLTEVERSGDDLKFVCKTELEALRGAAGGAKYKEILGTTAPLRDDLFH